MFANTKAYSGFAVNGGCCTKALRESRSAAAEMGASATRLSHMVLDRAGATGSVARFRTPPLETLSRSRRGFMQQPRREAVATRINGHSEDAG